MTPCLPPICDIRYVIDEWLDAPADWCAIPGFSALDQDTLDQVLVEAGNFVAGVLGGSR